MSDPLTPAPSTPEADSLRLQALLEDHRALRNAFHLTLAILLVLTGSLFIFFVREVSMARRQITDLSRVVQEYQKTAVPMMEDFRIKLQSFAKTNPDFLPIYTRYFGTSNSLVTPGSPGRAEGSPAAGGVRLPPGR